MRRWEMRVTQTYTVTTDAETSDEAEQYAYDVVRDGNAEIETTQVTVTRVEALG